MSLSNVDWRPAQQIGTRTLPEAKNGIQNTFLIQIMNHSKTFVEFHLMQALQPHIREKQQLVSDVQAKSAGDLSASRPMKPSDENLIRADARQPAGVSSFVNELAEKYCMPQDHGEDSPDTDFDDGRARDAGKSFLPAPYRSAQTKFLESLDIILKAANAKIALQQHLLDVSSVTAK